MPLLPTTLKSSDYVASETLADVDAWQARILVGNSMSQGRKRGDMEDVGYVMVRTVGEPAFIPIARSDEHNTGYELLYQFARKWRIKPDEFFPIFHKGNAGIYLYREADLPAALKAVERWHAAGGPEFIVCSAGYDGMPRWKVGSREFQRGGGKHPKGSVDGMLPAGQGFFDRLAALNACLSKLRLPHDAMSFDEGDRIGTRLLLRRAAALGDYVERYPDLAAEVVRRRGGSGYRFGTDLQDATAGWRAILEGHIVRGDIQGIQDLFLSHEGAKNMVHMAIRREIGEGSWSPRMKDLFGDLEMADAALGRISPGLMPDAAPAMALR